MAAAERFWLLEASCGSFLCCDGDGKTHLSSRASDSACWTQKPGGRLQHHKAKHTIEPGGEYKLFPGPEELPSVYAAALQETGYVIMTGLIPLDVISRIKANSQAEDGPDPATSDVARCATHPVVLHLMDVYTRQQDMRMGGGPAFNSEANRKLSGVRCVCVVCA